MVDFIIKLKNGESYHLKTEYKRVTVHNRMAMLYYIEQFSQVSRYDIKSITKATKEEVKGCSLVITVRRSMVQRFNAQ